MTVAKRTYTKLLVEFQPRPINSNSALERTYKLIDRLMNKEELSREEGEMLQMLSMLVEQYESREHPTPKVSAAEMLEHLIESRGISKSKLAAETGIPRSTITEIMSGARGISLANVAKFAAHFNVPATLFISHNSSERFNRVNIHR